MFTNARLFTIDKFTKIEIFYPDSVIMVRLTKPSNFKFPAQKLFQVLKDFNSHALPISVKKLSNQA